MADIIYALSGSLCTDLGLEVAPPGGGPGPLLAPGGEGVLLLPRQPELLGHVLGGDAHVDAEHGVRQSVGEEAVLQPHLAELHPRPHVHRVPRPGGGVQGLEVLEEGVEMEEVKED